MYVNEGELGKNVGLLLQENGKRIGLNVNIITKPFSSIYREHVLKRDFGITPFSSSLGPELDDFYASWHSDNTDPGESNFSGYRDEEADRIIEAIRTTRSSNQRIELYKELQIVVQEDMPVIFMYAPTETIVVSNRWIGSATSKRPGYLANTFIANK
jgi:peptide/nickel transport system substrate-binding protein